MIGAGLKALEKHEDGTAVKGLFYAFAVTQVILSCPVRMYSVRSHQFDTGGLRVSDCGG